jgi:hypothetical protein
MSSNVPSPWTWQIVWAVWHYERAFDGNHLPQAA